MSSAAAMGSRGSLGSHKHHTPEHPALRDYSMRQNRSRCLRFFGSLASVIKSFKHRREERRPQNSCGFPILEADLFFMTYLALEVMFSISIKSHNLREGNIDS